MSSFGGTVKLTGESEYRKALSEISSNLKVMNSEMKLVASQYDANDKSADKMNATHKVVNKQIEEQEKKVALLKKALEDSKKETGESSETTKKWQVQLNNAEAELNGMNNSLQDYGEETEKSSEKSLKLGDIIKANLISDAIKAGFKALVDSVKAVGEAFTSAIQGGAEYADTILTLSTQTHLSTDTLEKYNAVAELTDVSLDTLTNSMAKNIKSMASGKDAYKELGISLTDANGNMRDGEEVYWETIDALGQMTNETERDQMAMEIFGKSAQDLNTIIEMGSEGVAQYTEEAEKMGAVLGGDALASLGAMDDEFQKFKTTTSSTGNIIASIFAPAITDLTGGVNELLGSFNGLLSSIASGDKQGAMESMEEIKASVSSLLESASEMLPELLPIVQELLEAVVQLIVDNAPTLIRQGASLLMALVQGISSNLQTIIPVALEVILTLVRAIVDNLPMLIQEGIDCLVALMEGIGSMLPELIPLIISAILLIIETILDNIDQLIDAGISIIFGLISGILNALPELISKMPVLIDKLVTAITNNLPKLIEMGILLIGKLAVGIIKEIPNLVRQIPQVISSIVSGLKNGLGKLAEVGRNLVEGLWNGISNATQWVLDKIKGFGQSILSGIKSIFGIHSPSTVFRDEVGKNLALGLGEGFADEMTDVSNQMQGAIPTEFDASVNATYSAGGSTYDLMVSAFKSALKDVKVVMDDREMGAFVNSTIAREVFA